MHHTTFDPVRSPWPVLFTLAILVSACSSELPSVGESSPAPHSARTATSTAALAVAGDDGDDGDESVPQVARLVRDIQNYGIFPSPYLLGVVGDSVLFAWTSNAGREVWLSDGTREGTLSLGIGIDEDESEAHATESGDAIYFNDVRTSPAPLYRLDGERKTAARVGWSSGSFATLGESVIHRGCTDETASSCGIYKTDEDGSTVLLPYDDHFVAHAVSLGNAAYLLLRTTQDGGLGEEYRVWVTDGTPEGTQPVSEIPPGPDFSRLVVDGDTLFASTTSGNIWVVREGQTPWEVMGIDAVPGYESGNRVAALEDSVVVIGTAEGDSVPAIYSVDIATREPIRLADPAEVAPAYVTRLGNHVYFRANSTLFASDGTPEGTYRLFPEETTEIWHPPSAHDGRLWIFGGVSGQFGLFVSDGTAEGTTWLTGGEPDELGIGSGTSPYFFLRWNGEWDEVWLSDGTPEGTVAAPLVANTPDSIEPVGVSNWFDAPSRLQALADRVFFPVTRSLGEWGNAYELWTSDGSEGGTVSISDYPYAEPELFSRAVAVGDDLFYVTRAFGTSYLQVVNHDLNYFGELDSDGGGGVQILGTSNGRVIARTDDVIKAWTRELWTDVFEIPATHQPTRFSTQMGDRVAFVLETDTGSELYVADASEATLLWQGEAVEELVGIDAERVALSIGPEFELVVATPAGVVAPPTPRGFRLSARDGALIYVDPDDGNAVVRWHPEEGLRKQQLEKGSIFLAGPVAGPSRIFYAVYRVGSDYTRWLSTDFSAPEAGGDDLFFDEPGMVHPLDLRVIGDAVAFAADDGVFGAELWRSAGRGSTTRLVADIAPNGPGSSPSGFTRAGDDVFFVAADARGYELWAVPYTAIDTPPSLHCESSVVLAADDSGQAQVVGNIGVSTSDVETTAPVVTYSSETLSLGTTDVTVSVRDRGDNEVSCVVSVEVADLTPPTVSCPPDVTREATSPAGAVATWPAIPATDALSAQVDVSTDHASGDVFPIGTTPVRVTATDEAGNTETCSFTVTVVDTTEPEVTCPADFSGVEATSADGAVVTWPAIAATDVASVPTVTADHASGDVFPVGTTSVSVTATDPAGNTDSCSFTVTVVDTTKPALACPDEPIVVEASSANGAAATFEVTATDAVSEPTLTWSADSGATFPLGDTDVTVTATDGAGNASSCTFTVSVVDTTKPVLECPDGPIVVEASDANGATATFDATAMDAVSEPTIEWSVLSGSTFPIGDTDVTVTATDGEGNASSCTFTVTVVDTTKPVLECPEGPLLVDASDPNGATATFDVTATDAVSEPTIDWSAQSGSTFPVGDTEVTVTATDGAGNASTCTFTVTVKPPATTDPTDRAGCDCSGTGSANIAALLPLAIGLLRRRRQFAWVVTSTHKK